MSTIITLSPSLVAKIAAGEVIERPAYAVKELVENAIDAKATAITIHIAEAGLQRIQVIDNGEGMSRKDLEICFLPHTTSKLKHEDELIGIHTLGFRGEALSSIAGISHLTIQSRTQKSISGTIIEIQEGRVEHIGSVGIPPGTIVTVDHLFSALPARKKYLKSKQTEFRHITELLLHFALSYPTIHFTLTHNKKVILDLPIKQDSINRLTTVFGQDVVEHFLPLSFSDSYLNISGYIGNPHTALKNNRQQFIFVNNRFVTDKLIALAVKESFGTLLPSSSLPIFVLNLTLPYDVVDVNVHPRKEQVSFMNARHIFDLVKQAVTETLSQTTLPHPSSFTDFLRNGETTSLSATRLKETVLPWNRSDMGASTTNSPLLQIHQTYLLAVTKDGLLFVDQHAAHERILYEKFLQTFNNEKKKKSLSHVSKPIKLALSFSERQILEEYINVFQHLGFVLEYFGGNSFVIRQIPLVFKGRRIEKIIKDMLGDLSEDRTIKDIDTTSQKMLSFLSCRAAVKAGDSLSQSHTKTILQDLEKTQNNATCPHGRPTRFSLPLEMLHTLFKRK